MTPSWVPRSCVKTFLRLMSNLATPRSWAPRDTAEAVTVPRRHVLLLALLMCVPLPVLSVVATVLPLPEIIERAAANVVPFAEPPLSAGETLAVKRPSRSVHAGIVTAKRLVATPAPFSRETRATSRDKAATHEDAATRTLDASSPKGTLIRTTSQVDPAPTSTASDAPAAVAPMDSTSETSQHQPPSKRNAEDSHGNKPLEPPGHDKSGETGGTKEPGNSGAGGNK